MTDRETLVWCLGAGALITAGLVLIIWIAGGLG